MNLGQAVAVCLYELIRESDGALPSVQNEPGTAEELDRLTDVLSEALADSGYTKQGSRQSTTEKVRRLVRRLRLSSEDAVRLLQMEGELHKKVISQEEAIKAQWAQVENQLQRRNDLIPNLVNAVRGSMDFERDTLTAVMDARAKALTATGPADAAQKEGQLSQALGRLIAVA